ncbi:MAG: hypothetical protein GWM92_20330, partial [Gemmatimonadetes bacterium]|nr:hypothetical protein [Gemmatimonadota bacterium]NIT90020.1 hypothetical protein [Gemmatimonadota bacterium]NIU78396.1 hypothetical protein [Gammaproteobacteria bacterium]NIX42153.1 hypothetical protein [Gemmatimonadota bacterium]NIY41684.1 hypothetical protein [Gemmatimonadota bacterium]
MRSSLAILLLFLLSGLASSSTASAQDDGADPFAALRARAIGPAGMSGRVADVDVVLADRNVVYVGGSTGGLFKSADGGMTWDPVLDGQAALGV